MLEKYDKSYISFGKEIIMSSIKDEFIKKLITELNVINERQLEYHNKS